uniref:Uncharacterized protein n=1 Tax=Oryza meridionalis TaxID=40149 RepID=A0A0E0C6I4_9ORYZ
MAQRQGRGLHSGLAAAAYPIAARGLPASRLSRWRRQGRGPGPGHRWPAFARGGRQGRAGSPALSSRGGSRLAQRPVRDWDVRGAGARWAAGLERAR